MTTKASFRFLRLFTYLLNQPCAPIRPQPKQLEVKLWEISESVCQKSRLAFSLATLTIRDRAIFLKKDWRTNKSRRLTTTKQVVPTFFVNPKFSSFSKTHLLQKYPNRPPFHILKQDKGRKMQCDVQKTNLFFGFSKVKYYLCSREFVYPIHPIARWT